MRAETEYHFNEIFTGCTGSCNFDNFRCSQWWRFRQNDISVSVCVWRLSVHTLQIITAYCKLTCQCELITWLSTLCFVSKTLWYVPWSLHISTAATSHWLTTQNMAMRACMCVCVRTYVLYVCARCVVKFHCSKSYEEVWFVLKWVGVVLKKFSGDCN